MLIFPNSLHPKPFFFSFFHPHGDTPVHNKLKPSLQPLFFVTRYFFYLLFSAEKLIRDCKNKKRQGQNFCDRPSYKKELRRERKMFRKNSDALHKQKWRNIWPIKMRHLVSFSFASCERHFSYSQWAVIIFLSMPQKKTFFRTCPLPLSYCSLANVRFRWTMTRILWAKSKRNLTKHINAIISLKDMWLLFDVSILLKNPSEREILSKRYKKLANILPLLLSMKI